MSCFRCAKLATVCQSGMEAFRPGTDCRHLLYASTQALAMVPASATTTAEAPAAEAAAPAGPTIDPAVLNSGALNATQSPAERVEGVRWTPAPTLEKNCECVSLCRY